MRRRRSRTFAVVAYLLTLWSSLWLATLASAQQQPQEAGTVTTLKGQATIARGTPTRTASLNFRDKVFFQDRIGTERDAVVRVLMGGKALVTIRELSDVTITEEPNRSVVRMGLGRLALQVVKSLMRGEIVEIHTPNAVAAVRGSFVDVQTQRVNGAHQTILNTLGVEDPVPVADRPTLPGASVTLQSNQTVTFTGPPGAIAPHTIQNLTLAQQRAVRAAYTFPLPLGASPLQGPIATRGMGEATELANLALGGEGQPGGSRFPVNQLPPPNPGLENDFGSNRCGGPCQMVINPPAPASPPSGGLSGTVLVFGSDGRSFDRNNLAFTLRNLGNTVSVAGPLPNDLSTFKTIWHVAAFAPLTDGERASLVGFLARGGGVHLTGERPCCESLNAGAQALVNAVVVGGGVTVGGRGDISGPYPFNSAAVGGITINPNSLGQWFPPAPGGIAGVAGANVLVNGAAGVPVGAVWDSNSLVGSSGRLTLLMDIDWFNAADRQPIIENIQTFLLGGVRAPGAFGLEAFAPDHLISLDNEVLVKPGPLVENASSDIRVQKAALNMVNGSSATVLSQPAFVISGGNFEAERIANVQGSTLTLEKSLLTLLSGMARVDVRDDVLTVGQGAIVTGVGDEALIIVTGAAKAFDAESNLMLGSDKPLRAGGSLVRADGGTVEVNSILKIDPVLLEASLPLLNLTAGANLTSRADAFQITNQSHLNSTAASLVRLDASAMTIQNGHLFSVTGGSKLAAMGDLVSLSNKAMLNILNGTLLSATGGSFVNIRGALVAFGGVGNTVNITNALCGAGGACQNVGGLTVALMNGAVAANVNINNPIKNLAGNNVNLSPNGAHIGVSGNTTKVTIQGL